DALNRPKQIDEAVGTLEERRTLIGYDARDNVVSLTTGIAATNEHPSTTVTEYNAFDEARRVTEAVGTPEQRVTVLVHDPNGNLQETTDPRDYVTHTIFDP